MKKISIIGAGSFGTSLAIVLGHAGFSVTIWAREPEITTAINKNRKNPAYISDAELPEPVRASDSLEETVKAAEMIVFATPSHALREVAGKAAGSMNREQIVVTVSKGIEKDSLMTPSQVLADVLEPVIPKANIGILTGPSHAEEVSAFKPTTVVASAYSRKTAGEIQETFMTPMFRVYINQDILGAEIGGALKNIMAIAAGIIDGAELGDNAKAALMTRGLHEMKRMGTMLGARPETFSGLTGMGDLIVTCTSRHSRNRFVGYHIGKGKTLHEIVSGMNMVAEGIKTAQSVCLWARKNGVDMPITEAIYKVLFEGVDPGDAVHELMTRNAKDEVVI